LNFGAGHAAWGRRTWWRADGEVGIPPPEEIVSGAFHAFDQTVEKAPVSVNSSPASVITSGIR
jgi:hypothetical protein